MAGGTTETDKALELSMFDSADRDCLRADGTVSPAENVSVANVIMDSGVLDPSVVNKFKGGAVAGNGRVVRIARLCTPPLP